MTNTVNFPGLGLEFTPNRVAASPFGFNIYWYAVIIVAGAVLAWFYCSRKGPKLGISDDDLTDLLIFAVSLALVGARLYYILFYLDLFKNEDGSLNFSKMLDVRDGGLAIYGGVIAAVIVLFFVCRYKKIPFLAFADLGGMGLLIGQCIGRWGNFVNVEAYGGLTDLPWRMCSEKIANELYARGLVDAAEWQQVVDGTLGVHPTFFYESAWNLAGFLLLVLISRRWRKFDGQLFFTYLAWYGVGRGIIEGMRTDSLYFMNTPIRVSQVLGFASALAAVILWVWFYLHRPAPDQLWVNRRAAMEAAKAEQAAAPRQEDMDTHSEKEDEDNGSDHH